MHVDKNTHENNFRKAAKTVGTVIGNYHPHGDSSVYDAMVRLSQDWKVKHELIEMHGNNGSIDGDPAAELRNQKEGYPTIPPEWVRVLVKKMFNFIQTLIKQTQKLAVFQQSFQNF